VKPGWNHATLAELVQPVAKVDPKSDFRETNFTYIDLSAIDRDLKHISDATVVPATDAPSRARQLLRQGDVLVSTVRPNLNAVATVGPDLDGAIGSTGFTVLRPNNALDGRYLFHWVTTEAFVRSMVRQATGASYPAISDRIVKAAQIPLPPLAEQLRIASVLDAASAIRRLRQRTLTLARVLRVSLFVAHFGDPLAPSDNADKATLREVVPDIRIGPFGSVLHKEDYAQAGIPVINPIHISEGRVIPDDKFSVSPEKRDQLATYALRNGDVILGRRGEMGRCAVIGKAEDGYLCGTGSMILRPDPVRADPVYLQAVLSFPSVRTALERASLGATLPNINKSIVERLSVSVPNIGEQRAFAQSVRQLESVVRSQVAHEQVLESLFAVLQHRAFNGEL
jgi:type I restriction enzyme S subunit